jgi:hypothetical protein
MKMEPTAEEIDAEIEEQYASLLEDNDRMNALMERAEELTTFLTKETSVPKLVYYSTALAAVYRQLDMAKILYIE